LLQIATTADRMKQIYLLQIGWIEQNYFHRKYAINERTKRRIVWKRVDWEELITKER